MPKEEYSDIVTEEDVGNFISHLEKTGSQDIHQAIYGEEVDDDMVASSRKPTRRSEGKA